MLLHLPCLSAVTFDPDLSVTVNISGLNLGVSLLDFFCIQITKNDLILNSTPENRL